MTDLNNVRSEISEIRGEIEANRKNPLALATKSIDFSLRMLDLIEAITTEVDQCQRKSSDT